jgi:hypothetical protein
MYFPDPCARLTFDPNSEQPNSALLSVTDTLQPFAFFTFQVGLTGTIARCQIVDRLTFAALLLSVMIFVSR